MDWKLRTSSHLLGSTQDFGNEPGFSPGFCTDAVLNQGDEGGGTRG